MTTNANWKQYENTPPPNNPEVARIMGETGLGRRKAYALFKKRQAEAIDTADVKPSQRLAVMAVLINDTEARKAVPTLLAALHAIGTKIDGHDVVKTLWALQKQGWIGFREKARNGGYYAITVKQQGYEGYEELVRQRQENGIAHAIAVVEAVVEEPPAPEPEPIPEPEPDEEFLGLDVKDDEVYIVPFDLGDFPLISRLMERAVTVERLNAAATILEEVGETDIALVIMEKAGINPLEREVIDLVRKVS